MNIAAKRRVLLYGDSFVYGKIPRENARYAADKRFSGILQNILGDDWEVIEEGLRARTFAGENGFFPYRDGLEQFVPIAGSHLPLDWLVIFLGTNDANAKGPQDIKSHVHHLTQYQEGLKEIAQFLGCEVPNILIVVPPAINAEKYDDVMEKVFGEQAPDRVEKFSNELLSLAKVRELTVIDSRGIISPSSDGIHLDEKDNAILAQTIAGSIK